MGKLSGVCASGWRLGCVLLLLCATAAQAQPVAALPPVPMEAFFGPAKLRDASLSPSGRWLAALTSVPGRRVGVQVIDLDGQEAPKFIEASATDDVAWFRWVSEDWLVFSVQDTVLNRYVYKGPGLMAMRRDGSDSRLIIRRNSPDSDGYGALGYRHYFLGLGAPGSNEVLLGYAHDDASGRYTHTSVYAYNVAKGGTRQLHEGSPRFERWWFDPQGRARLATQYEDQHTVYWWADAGVNPTWRQIARQSALEPTFAPAYIEGDTLMVATAESSGHLELRPFDFEAGKPGGPALLSTPGFDGGVAPVREGGSGRVLGLHLLLDASTTVWFTPDMKAIQAEVDAKFPNSINVLGCRPCANPQAVLVYSYSDIDPGRYVVYRPRQNKWQLVGEVRPDIEPQRMARLALHRTTARDGEDLPVWVTRPPNLPADKPAPAVVLVHGGPHERGVSWHWNSEAQFLASRGYVVIEPEFRGSTGYGIKHYRAGWKQWGQAMQDDVTDALQFAVKQGWADPARVCIMGGSYGGYSALMGLVKDPDQYRCGIAFAAVTDPRFRFDFHWSDASQRSLRDFLPMMMGDPKKDAAMLAAVSPIEQVQRIKAPVLLMHGDDDRRVPIEHGERMRDALRKAGKTFEWVVFVDEGHGFIRPKNEMDYWQRIEAFLARHLR